MTTCGGMHLLQSSLRTMPCWPLLSVWRMDPNVTVGSCLNDTNQIQIFRIRFFRFRFLLTAIGRTLIPRYFRSIFEGGATELYYVLKHPKESFHNNFVSLDCDQCTMVTQNGKPMFTQVCMCRGYLRRYWGQIQLVLLKTVIFKDEISVCPSE